MNGIKEKEKKRYGMKWVIIGKKRNNNIRESFRYLKGLTIFSLITPQNKKH